MNPASTIGRSKPRASSGNRPCTAAPRSRGSHGAAEPTSYMERIAEQQKEEMQQRLERAAELGQLARRAQKSTGRS